MLAAILFLPVKAHALSAEKSILMDGQTGRCLYEQRADERSLIASTTKIMTALVVCEQCNVLDRVRIPKEAVGIEGSSMYLKEGEVLTVQELLYGMMLHSGNDAAMALAIYCGGTAEGFGEMMNDKARLLGMHGSHFENPHGLDSPGHYSTARDLAILAAYAMDNPIFRQTVGTKQVKAGERYLKNHNKLLWRIEGAEGIKTGYTKASGRILVSSTIRQGRRLIAVTINAPDDWNDHKQLIEKGYSEYTVKQLVAKGQCLGQMEVISGTSDQVPLLASEAFQYSLAETENVTILLPSWDFVYAPVQAGDYAGDGYILLNGRLIGQIPLCFGQSVSEIS